jgi:hypothetical protein
MAVVINGSVVNYRPGLDQTAPSTTIPSVATGEGILVLVHCNKNSGGAVVANSVDVGSATGIGQIGTAFNPGASFGFERWSAFLYPNSSQSGTLTVTANLSAADRARLIICRLSGHDTGTYTGATNTGTGTTDDPSITLSVAANSAIFGILSTLDAVPGAGTGYTQLALAEGPAEWYAYTEYDLDAGGAGSKNVAFTTSGAEPWGVFAFEIKVSSGGSGGIPRAAMYYNRRD